MALSTTKIAKAADIARSMGDIRSMSISTSFESFKNLYMGSSADLSLRLGIAENSSSTENTVDSSYYPPYTKATTVTSVGLPNRSLGFYQLNTYINQLQNLLKIVSGEVRTKITEWDLSKYIQEGLYSAADIPSFSLTYRLKEDNLTGYKDNRAYQMGLLNAALSPAKLKKYNPSADPDLVDWAPLCSESDLLALDKTSLTDSQKESVKKDIIESGWNSWYPEYWRLFYKNNPSLNTTDVEDTDNALENSGGATTTTSTGLNLKSPIFYGRPYGANKSSSSLKGYIENSSPSYPKLPVTSTDLVAKQYPYINPIIGLNSLLNGWKTQWIEVQTQVVRSVRVYRRDEGYDQEDITVEVEVKNEAEGFWPEAEGTLTKGTYTNNSVWKTKLSTIFKGQLTLNIYDLKNIDGFDTALLAAGNEVPALFLSADNRIAFIAPIKRVKNTRVYYSNKQVTVGSIVLFTIPIPKIETTYIYEVNLSNISLLYTDASQESFFDLGVNIDQVLNNIKIKGIFFSFPARSLVDTDNIVTDKWADGISANQGALIGKAFTTYTWETKVNLPTSGSVTVGIGAPLKAICSYLDSKVLSKMEAELGALQTVMEIGINNCGQIVSLIDSFLPEDSQNTPEIVSAREYFSSATTSDTFKQAYSSFSNNGVNSLRTIIQSITSPLGILGYTKKNITDLLYQYPNTVTFLQSESLSVLLKHYLNVLYYRRLEILKQRLNIESGTLYRCGALTYSNLLTTLSKDFPPQGLEYVDENLKVVHTILSVSSAERLRGASIENATLKKVYVEVSYDSTGEIIRPKQGEYDLVSQEIINNESTLSPVSFFITFEEPNAPPIIKNVLTNIDPGILLSVINNKGLTNLEKICAARKIADWWEIEIPSSVSALASNFQNNLQLILKKGEDEIEGTSKILGGVTLSPIRDDI